MPKKSRIVAASGLLLVATAALLLEHLHVIGGAWLQGMVISATLAVCAIAAYFEYRST
ncbi:MAG TPA: hypothetical protein VMU57_16800 [Edaphobacter sp.]|uniref:hypothetical protein n=1 Tax=Edaphobacter sp. TaxID=1934404 RepID=UPI002C906108|nr:hypothetical protein [Edaphobacter sp.]HUZ96562.1 hypothetical protein [Edaphobacter sp.]